jgi:hypothetical protein
MKSLVNSFETKYFCSDFSIIHIKQLTKSLNPRCELSMDTKKLGCRRTDTNLIITIYSIYSVTLMVQAPGSSARWARSIQWHDL